LKSKNSLALSLPKVQSSNSLTIVLQIALQNGPCPGDILCDLRLESIGVGKGQLVAEPVHVGDPEFLVVEIGVEIEEVDFEGVDAIGVKVGRLPRS